MLAAGSYCEFDAEQNAVLSNCSERPRIWWQLCRDIPLQVRIWINLFYLFLSSQSQICDWEKEKEKSTLLGPELSIKQNSVLGGHNNKDEPRFVAFRQSQVCVYYRAKRPMHSPLSQNPSVYSCHTRSLLLAPQSPLSILEFFQINCLYISHHKKEAQILFNFNSICWTKLFKSPSFHSSL